MAEVVPNPDWTMQARQIYPWHEWLDGQTWRIVVGEDLKFRPEDWDFDTAAERNKAVIDRFLTAADQARKRRDGKITRTCNVAEGWCEIQFTPAGERDPRTGKPVRSRRTP